jgi:hypothetical protein
VASTAAQLCAVLLVATHFVVMWLWRTVSGVGLLQQRICLRICQKVMLQQPSSVSSRHVGRELSGILSENACAVVLHAWAWQYCCAVLVLGLCSMLGGQTQLCLQQTRASGRHSSSVQGCHGQT